MSGNPIIITDDDQEDSEMMAQALNETFEGKKPIIQMPDGKQLLALLSDLVVDPELILIDMFMPKVDGLDLLRNLRASNQLSTVPIVIMSGDKYILDNAYRAGADGFYSKPATIEGFLEIAADIKRNFFDRF